MRFSSQHERNIIRSWAFGCRRPGLVLGAALILATCTNEPRLDVHWDAPDRFEMRFKTSLSAMMQPLSPADQDRLKRFMIHEVIRLPSAPNDSQRVFELQEVFQMSPDEFLEDEAKKPLAIFADKTATEILDDANRTLDCPGPRNTQCVHYEAPPIDAQIASLRAVLFDRLPKYTTDEYLSLKQKVAGLARERATFKEALANLVISVAQVTPYSKTPILR